MHMYPRLSEPYFVAVEQITTNYNGKDYSGNTVDLEKIRKEGKEQYLPKRIHLMMDLSYLKQEIKYRKKKLRDYTGLQRK